ncbi:MAG: hypothetical protein FJY97_01860 [candidate division Zixibacteria bacterium]|nr:hypothetical protein [candidate division Zixibacteria bacterium]
MSHAPIEYDVHGERDTRPQPPVSIGSERQLLFDDFFLVMAGRAQWDQLAYRIKFANGRVTKHGSPLFYADAPWETGTAWLCVIREENRYRMWYNSAHADRRGLRVSYAESSDGFHFERPLVNRVAVDGAMANNVVFEGGFRGVSPELGNVFVDPTASDAERYKMVYADWQDPSIFLLQHNGTTGTLRGAYSPDGIRWKRYIEDFTGGYPDSQNCAMWDSVLERYVAYHRASCDFGGLEYGDTRVRPQHRGRSLARMESYNFRNWSRSEPSLVPDETDGLNTDIYNNGYARHPDTPHAHYLFPSFYRHYEGTFEVQALTSRDNRRWGRQCRDTFIPLGEPGAFDSFIISTAPGIVPIDTDTWALYYRSGDGPHGGSHPITLSYTPQSRVSRVTTKRDRVTGIEGAPEGGHFSTRPISFMGDRLIINAEPVGPDPEIRVQLLSSVTHQPLPGYTFEDCVPLREDGTGLPVMWQGETMIGDDVPRGSVRLHIRIRAMRMYAFRFC